MFKKTTKINLTCPVCGEPHTVELNDEQTFKWASFKRGEENIQDALPDLEAWEREALSTGFCKSCQRGIFARPIGDLNSYDEENDILVVMCEVGKEPYVASISTKGRHFAVACGGDVFFCKPSDWRAGYNRLTICLSKEEQRLGKNPNRKCRISDYNTDTIYGDFFVLCEDPKCGFRSLCDNEIDFVFEEFSKSVSGTEFAEYKLLRKEFRTFENFCEVNEIENYKNIDEALVRCFLQHSYEQNGIDGALDFAEKLVDHLEGIGSTYDYFNKHNSYLDGNCFCSATTDFLEAPLNADGDVLETDLTIADIIRNRFKIWVD